VQRHEARSLCLSLGSRQPFTPEHILLLEMKARQITTSFHEIDYFSPSGRDENSTGQYSLDPGNQCGIQTKRHHRARSRELYSSALDIVTRHS
jgi:hypothetical protein